MGELLKSIIASMPEGMKKHLLNIIITAFLYFALLFLFWNDFKEFEMLLRIILSVGTSIAMECVLWVGRFILATAEMNFCAIERRILVVHFSIIIPAVILGFFMDYKTTALWIVFAYRSVVFLVFFCCFARKNILQSRKMK